jgi:hypothetical protein
MRLLRSNSAFLGFFRLDEKIIYFKRIHPIPAHPASSTPEFTGLKTPLNAGLTGGIIFFKMLLYKEGCNI